MDRRIAPLVLLSACLWIGEAEHAGRLDPDGDGVRAPGDCDNGDQLVSPARPELACDGRDNDCDPNTPDGPASIEGRTYASIAAAVEAAVVGAVVEVCPGTHAEAVVVDKELTLESVGAAEQTVIDATGLGAPVVRITSGGVTLRNLTLTGGTGGGIQAADAAGAVRVEACVVAGNTGDFGGGIVGPASGSLELIGTTVRGNSSTGAAGGIALLSTASLSAVTIADNTAATDGGGLWIAEGAAVAADFDTMVRDNQAARGGGAWIGPGATFSSATFEGNVASAEGGGLHATGATVASTTVQSNSAPLGGGAVATGRLDACTFTGNEADSGGGIYAPGDLVVDGGAITDNTATESGGGVHVTGGLLSVEGEARIERNGATSGGGLAAVDAALDMLGATVEDNTATRGGGLYVDDRGGCPVAQGCASQVTSVRIANNDAVEQGGGVWTNHATTLSSCMVSANGADQGGGVHVEEPGAVTFATSTLQANSADLGGALHVSSTTGTTQVDRGEMTSNVGDNGGAAIHVSLGQVACDGVRIWDNVAPAGAAVTLVDGGGFVNRYDSTLCDYDNASDLKVGIGYQQAELPDIFTCQYGYALGPSCD